MVTIINYITHIYVLCKPTCRQRCDERLLQAEGPFKCVAFGASAKGAARADFACVAGLVGRRYGGAAPGANDNAGKWLECAGEKNDRHGGALPCRSQRWHGSDPSSDKGKGCGADSSSSISVWQGAEWLSVAVGTLKPLIAISFLPCTYLRCALKTFFNAICASGGLLFWPAVDVHLLCYFCQFNNTKKRQFHAAPGFLF